MIKPVMRTEGSKQGLRDMIKYIQKTDNTKEMTILEIGSYMGDSTEIFAQNFKSVTCVDPWNDHHEIICNYPMDLVFEEFLKKIKKYDNKVEYYRMTSDRFFITFEQLLQTIRWDIIYIDGMHTYDAVRTDIMMFKPYISKYICGHDYHRTKFSGVIKAVNDCLGQPDVIFKDTSWLIKKEQK